VVKGPYFVNSIVQLLYVVYVGSKHKKAVLMHRTPREAKAVTGCERSGKSIWRSE